MPEPATVTVRYWAAARAAAGRDCDVVSPGTLEQVLSQVRDQHGVARGSVEQRTELGRQHSYRVGQQRQRRQHLHR